MLYKKITPHLVAQYRASPGPAEKRRRGEGGGLNRTVCWGGITHWRQVCNENQVPSSKGRV